MSLITSLCLWQGSPLPVCPAASYQALPHTPREVVVGNTGEGKGEVVGEGKKGEN